MKNRLMGLMLFFWAVIGMAYGNKIGAWCTRSCPDLDTAACRCTFEPTLPANSVVHIQTVQCADECFYLVEERLVSDSTPVSWNIGCVPSDYAALLKVVDCQCREVGSTLYTVVKPLQAGFEQINPVTDPFLRFFYMAQPVLYNLASGSYVLTLAPALAQQLFATQTLEEAQALVNTLPLTVEVHQVTAAGFVFVGSVDVRSDAFSYNDLPTFLTPFSDICADLSSAAGIPAGFSAFIPVECGGELFLLLVEPEASGYPYTTSKIHAFRLDGTSFNFLNTLTLNNSAYTKHFGLLLGLQALYAGPEGIFSRFAEPLLSRLVRNTFFECAGRCRFLNIAPYDPPLASGDIVEMYDFDRTTGFASTPTGVIETYESSSDHRVFATVKTCGDKCYLVVNDLPLTSGSAQASIVRLFVITDYGFEQIELANELAPGFIDSGFIHGSGYDEYIYLGGSGARIFLQDLVVAHPVSCGDRCFVFMMHSGVCYTGFGSGSGANGCVTSIDIWEINGSSATYLGTADGGDSFLLFVQAFPLVEPNFSFANEILSLPLFGGFQGVLSGLATRSYVSTFENLLTTCGDACYFMFSNGSEQQLFSIGSYGIEKFTSYMTDTQSSVFVSNLFSCGAACYAISSVLDQGPGGGILDIYRLNDYGAFELIQSIDPVTPNAQAFAVYAKMITCPHNDQCVLIIAENALDSSGQLIQAFRVFFAKPDGTFVEIGMPSSVVYPASNGDQVALLSNLANIEFFQAMTLIPTFVFFNADTISFAVSMFKDQIIQPKLSLIDPWNSRFNLTFTNLTCLYNLNTTPIDTKKLAVCAYAEMIKMGVDAKTLVCLIKPFVDDAMFICRLLRCILETPGMGISALQSWLFAIGQQVDLSTNDRVALGKNMLIADLGSQFITKQVSDFVYQHMLFGLADGLNRSALIACQMGASTEQDAVESLAQQVVGSITQL